MDFEQDTTNPSFLENLDIFGIGINIRFNKRATHNTRIGGLFTLLILFIMGYQIRNTIENILDTSHPTVLVEQRKTDVQERYDFAKNKMFFVFGIQDLETNAMLDSAYFKANLFTISDSYTYDPIKKEQIKKTSKRQIKLDKCKNSNYSSSEMNQYFPNLNYNDLLCISKEEQDISIEGQEGSQVDTDLRFIVEANLSTQCTQSEKQCKEQQQQIYQIFNNSKLSVYYIDYSINPSNYNNPFQPFGNYQQWISGGVGLSKLVTMELRNTVIKTDQGIFDPIIQFVRKLVFSKATDTVKQSQNNIIFDCKISIEKNFTTEYRRSYLKLDKAVSQFGGIFNLFFILCAFICKPLSQIELNRKLIKRIFNFELSEEDEQLNNQNNNQQLQKQCQNFKEQCQISTRQTSVPHIQSQFSNKEIKNLKRQTSYGSSTFQRLYEVKNASSNSQTIRPMRSCTVENPIQQTLKHSKTLKPTQSEIIESPVDICKFKIIFDKIFKEGRNFISFKRIEYFWNQIAVFQFCRNRKQKLLQKGIDNLYTHIDIFYLIQKMIEVEKLKMLLLNENQIKLFEFIPKPLLKTEINKPKAEWDRFKGIFHQQKGIIQKTGEAQSAFQNIIKQEQGLSRTDQRLIELLDPKFKSFLKELDQSNINLSMIKSSQGANEKIDTPTSGKESMKILENNSDEKIGYLATSDIIITHFIAQHSQNAQSSYCSNEKINTQTNGKQVTKILENNNEVEIYQTATSDILETDDNTKNQQTNIQECYNRDTKNNETSKINHL